MKITCNKCGKQIASVGRVLRHRKACFTVFERGGVFKASFGTWGAGFDGVSLGQFTNKKGAEAALILAQMKALRERFRFLMR